MEQIVTCSNPVGKGAMRVSEKIQNGAAGFTLVEMMVALVILSVSILALAGVTITAMKTNLDNDVRNTAIRLTTEAANDRFDQSFDTLATGSETRTVQIRGVDFDFTVNWVVSSPTASLKQIVITVSYELRGVDKSNTAVFYRPRAV